MPIEVIFKERQPEEYKKLQKIRHSKPKIKITDDDAKELMDHSSYKRVGRAIRQVRWDGESC